MTGAHTTNGRGYQRQSITVDLLISTTEVIQLTSHLNSTINLWVAQVKFPKPIALSPTIKVWRSQSLRDWIEMQSNNKSQNAKSISSNEMEG